MFAFNFIQIKSKGIINIYSFILFQIFTIYKNFSVADIKGPKVWIYTFAERQLSRYIGLSLWIINILFTSFILI